jgi:hypothetical protein
MSIYTKSELDDIARSALIINYIDISNVLNKIKQLYIDNIVIKTFEILTDIIIEHEHEYYDEIQLINIKNNLQNISTVFIGKSDEDILKFIYYHYDYMNRDKTLIGFMLNLYNANTIIIDAIRDKNYNVLNMVFELINIKNKIINNLHDNDFTKPLQLQSFLDSELDTARVISTTYNVFLGHTYVNIINTYWTGPFIIIDDITSHFYKVLYDEGRSVKNEYEFLYIPSNILVKKETNDIKPILYIYHKKEYFDKWYTTWTFNIIDSFIKSIKELILKYYKINIETIKKEINDEIIKILSICMKIHPDNINSGATIIFNFLCEKEESQEEYEFETISLLIYTLADLYKYLKDNHKFKNMIYNLYRLTYDYSKYIFNYNGKDYVFLENFTSLTAPIHFIHGDQQFNNMLTILSYNNIDPVLYTIIEYNDIGILDDYSIFNSIEFQKFYNKSDFMIGGKNLRGYIKYILKIKQILNIK